MSRIGILPIDLPSGVTVTISDTNEVKVKGPKGEISQKVDADIKVEVKENQVIVSRPSEEIINEVMELVNKGYKSITLLGQNVNSYGLDKKGEEITFAELLEKIGQYGDISGNEFWTYFTSPHPRDMGNDVIDVIARYKCLAKQIHLPLQSGDDKVLIRMNRKHK